MTDGLEHGADGVCRCWWCGADPEYQRYHDKEWGRPVTSDIRLFEKICLEGFQSGLSWITILRKRENFRRAFAGFEIAKVAAFDESDVQRMLEDAGIIRHRGKIEASINNAKRALELQGEAGSLANYFWTYADVSPRPAPIKGEIPGSTEVSTKLSKDLKKRGWKFVGPTTAYAFMQAMGVVNDHLEGCSLRPEVEAQRQLHLQTV
jgi:DNA-3-methyladenine glycosylase I